jgi:polyphosphate kinase 2
MSKKEKHEGKVKIWVKEEKLKYEADLESLQVELLKLQGHVKEHGCKVLIIIEGRDSSGKGGIIKRITEHINPRGTRVVALGTPSDVEKSQWYFQRYVQHLPSAGEIVIMDRSWYNRGLVEPVMGFCTQKQHTEFLDKVPKFENMLVSSGIKMIKLYLSITKKEQAKRFKAREEDPLKQYKLSPVDRKAQELWDKYSMAKYSMLIASHNPSAPWTIIRSDDKKTARLNALKHILNQINYENEIKGDLLIEDKSVVIDGYDEITNIEKKNIFDKVK